MVNYWVVDLNRHLVRNVADTNKPDISEIHRFLRSVRILQTLTDPELSTLAEQCNWRLLSSREVLFRQGEPLSSLFLLYSGKVHYHKTNESDQIVAQGVMKPGDSLGEIGLLRGERAIATAYGVRNCQIVEIDWPVFKQILSENATTTMALGAKIVEQADRSFNAIVRPIPLTTFAVVPLSKGCATEFCEQLNQALGKSGDSILINRKFIESELGTGRADLKFGDPGFAENLQWLAKLASTYEFAVFEADFDKTPWSLECVREADRILLVGSNEEALSPLEKHLATEQNEFSPERELVILSSKDSSAAKMIEPRSVTRWHHVKDGKYFSRLVRKLLGKSVGLALGGGGVRAAAHIGLIRAFEENAIPIDHISGTSIGSLIGALYAKGMSTTKMEHIIQEEIVNANLFNDYTFPLVSLVNGGKFTSFLQEIIGDGLIEDFNIDYLAATTNLSSGNLELWDRGTAWQAVRASASLPAILPPFSRQNQLYLDGGLLDNVPAVGLRERGVGHVFAIDVSAGAESTADVVYSKIVKSSGVAPSFLRWWRKRKNHPKITDVVVRSMVIGSREQTRRAKAVSDLYLRLPVEEWKMLDFKATAELIQVGYRHTIENIAACKKVLTESRG